MAYSKQIVDAMEYAHDHGVIHRDLKPANIKITPDGVVKVLDFGLAKALDQHTAVSLDPENSPTLTIGGTQAGVIMGTTAYMSPEQAVGKAADRRADIFSFGAVLYEMLTGKRWFRRLGLARRHSEWHSLGDRGSNGAAYIGVRDMSDAVWMGRQAGATFTGWQPGGGTIATDPQVADSGGKVYAVAIATGGVAWYNTFAEGTGNNWAEWISPGGPALMDVTAAVGTRPQLFLSGRDANNHFWWYETPGAGWKPVVMSSTPAGPAAAAPK